MGNHKSHLRRHLSHGDENAALELLKSHEDFRKRLDVHVNYEKNDGSTCFHLACLHGMETMIRTFLNQYGIDIAQRNALQETAIHCLCRLPSSSVVKDLPQYHGAQRHKCLKLILELTGSDFAGLAIVRETYLMKDLHGNTPLHNAAAHGFLEIAEEIVAANTATLRLQNSHAETPVDLADQYGHQSVASFLESKTIFLPSHRDASDGEEEIEDWTAGHTQSFDGMKVQDLQHKKDQLVVETSDMLHLPLFTAEALLRTFQWSRQALLDAWFENAVQCCKNAGVKPPDTLNRRRKNPTTTTSQDLELGSPKRTIVRKIDSVCPICSDDMSQEEEQPVYLACEHDFCRSCWQQYLTMKIQEGNIYPIICPDSQCSMLVPCDVIEGLVSRDVARRYLQFDIEAFVESNPSMKWCPFAEAAGTCGRAVCRPEMPGPTALLIPHMKPPLQTSHAVDCGNGHYFCWECSGDAHEPCSCDKWTEWHQRIIDVKPEEIRGTHEALEEAANSLWLATNSKPCPFCRSPIQKTDGCNHMKCSKCKHDFCWICGEAWKKHSTATGGYFRCTRFDAVHKAQNDAGKLISAAEEKSRRLNELNRFVLYYGKFKMHEDALKKSLFFLDHMKEKVASLAQYLNIPEDQLQFLQEAAVELRKARKVLKGSFVYAYYLEDHRVLFEYMQQELEKSVEKLNGMICVRFLRTCKDDIRTATRTVRRRRLEFIVAVNKGLIIPETPPSVRKKRKRRLPGLFGLDFDDVVLQEDAGKNGGTVSLPEHDPANPWVLDKRGRHANFAALYDWPEIEDSEEDISTLLATSSVGIAPCARTRCSRPCAKNPRTGVYHQHCSLRCKRYHEDELKASNNEDGPSTSGSSQVAHKLDLIIAMELSRLQMRRDLENRASSFSSGSTVADFGGSQRRATGVTQEDDFQDSDSDDPALGLAVQLSLKELHERKQLSMEVNDAGITTSGDHWEVADMDSNESGSGSGSGSSGSSLNSGDFTQLTANELLLDHLQKLTDENTLKNTEPDGSGSNSTK